MRIEQKPKFQPITLTIETAHEAELLWAMVQAFPAESSTKNLLCDWFSNQAQLGGRK